MNLHLLADDIVFYYYNNIKSILGNSLLVPVTECKKTYVWFLIFKYSSFIVVSAVGEAFCTFTSLISLVFFCLFSYKKFFL